MLKERAIIYPSSFKNIFHQQIAIPSTLAPINTHTYQTWGQFNSRIGIGYLKNGNGIGIDKFLIRIEKFLIGIPTKKLNPEISLQFLLH